MSKLIATYAAKFWDNLLWNQKEKNGMNILPEKYQDLKMHIV